MNQQLFQKQMERLKGTWRNSYGEDRTCLLWEKLNHLSDEFMVDAITEFIANRRSAPMLNDFFEYQQKFNNRKFGSQIRGNNFSPLMALQKAFKAASFQDPAVRDRVKRRLTAVRSFCSGQMTRLEFDSALDAIEAEMGTQSFVDCGK